MRGKAFFEALGQSDATRYARMESYLRVRYLYIWPQWAIIAYTNGFYGVKLHEHTTYPVRKD